MSGCRDESFAGFVATSAAPLLTCLAESLQASLSIVNAEGRQIFAHASEIPSPGPTSTVSMELDGESFGTLRLSGDRPALDGLARTLATDITDRFVSERDLDRLTDQLSECYDELNLLFRLTRAQTPDASFGQSCRRLLTETARFLDDRHVMLWLEDDVVLAVCRGDGDTPAPDIAEFVRNRSAVRRIREHMADEAQRRGDGQLWRHTGVAGERKASIAYLTIPVWTRKRVSGYVGLLRTAAEPRPETGEVRLLEVLAGQLSGASTTRELFTEIKGVLFSTVKSLVAAIDAKDAYTKGHSQRVYELSVRVGERFGLAEDLLQTLTWAALLHDVGKIAIPRRILCKPGRLTPEEFEIIKTHPERGCLVIQPIPQFRSLLPGIRHHHERFDGRGYPDGLAGRDIPLIARIIAVADTFDAMVSTRAYRDARPFDDAIQEIRDSAGTQLDPDIAAAFLDLAERGEITAPAGQKPVPEAA